MSNSDLNIIKNVIVSAGSNNLKLAEIYFNNSISEIKYLSDEFDWKEIETAEKKNHFLSKHKTQNKVNPKAIDGSFNLIIPGTIDSHVHFNTPGFEQREDFEHASSAAAFGGVTTIIDMPCTSLPPVNSVENFATKLHALQNKSYVDYAFWGGISGIDFENNVDISNQINKLSEAGVVGFKAYLISGMETFTDLNLNQMNQIAKMVFKTGKPLAIHAEDKFLVETRTKQFQKENKNSWIEYCKSRDVLAEEKAIKDMIKIAKASGVKTHIVHLSSKVGLNLISDAQKSGVKITSETCPHYLYFTQNDFNNPKISNYLKTAPPVKFEEDKFALWKGLSDGTLSFVVTDHAGSIPERDKSSENFWNVYGGIPGVEHRVPFLFSEGFLKGRLTLEQTINLLSKNVSNFFGLKKKGELIKGFDADFALINLWNNEVITANNMHSKGKYTPFEGVQFNATVEKTWLRGSLIAEKDKQIGNRLIGDFIAVN